MSAKALAIIVLVCASLYRLNYYFVDYYIIVKIEKKLKKKLSPLNPQHEKQNYGKMLLLNNYDFPSH